MKTIKLAETKFPGLPLSIISCRVRAYEVIFPAPYWHLAFFEDTVLKLGLSISYGTCQSRFPALSYCHLAFCTFWQVSHHIVADSTCPAWANWRDNRWANFEGLFSE